MQLYYITLNTHSKNRLVGTQRIRKSSKGHSFKNNEVFFMKIISIPPSIKFTNSALSSIFSQFFIPSLPLDDFDSCTNCINFEIYFHFLSKKYALISWAKKYLKNSIHIFNFKCFRILAPNDLMETDEPQQAEQKQSKMTADKAVEKPFTLKKWNLVATWAWDVECDTCAICRVHLMEACLRCQSDSKQQECVVIWGECNHCFHLCCMSLWVKQNNRCPLCQSDWSVQRVGK